MPDFNLAPVWRLRRKTASSSLSLLVIGTACTDQQPNDRSFAATNQTISIQSGKSIGITLRDSSLAICDTVSIQWPAFGTLKTTSARSGKKYFTSDKTIATIDRDGLVRVMHGGLATVSARTAARATGFITIAVGPGALPSVPPPAGTSPNGALPRFVTPQLPTSIVNIDLPAALLRSVRIPAVDPAALQSALDTAVGGDEIVPADGAVYTGSICPPKRLSGGLPAKSC